MYAYVHILRNGIMEEGSGPIRTPNLFVPKKTLYASGRPDIRTIGDNRKVNLATNKDAYIMENMEMVLE